MGPSLKHRSIAEFAAMSADDSRALRSAAGELQVAMRSGVAHRVLRGKNLALLCNASDAAGEAAVSFQRAASALGAQVAQLPSSLNESSTAEQVQHTARMLGRLYDGIECIGLSAELVQRIAAAAGVPVLEAMSSVEHVSASLADQGAELIAADDRRCAVIQAMLIAALA